MAKSPTRPVVVASVTTFGDRLHRAGRWSKVCAAADVPLQFVPSGPDVVGRLAPALTEALRVRRETPEWLLADHVCRQRPRVTLLGAAAELSDVDALTQAAAALKREFRRTDLAGVVALVVYCGPVAGRLPDDAIIRELEAISGFDVRLVFGDADGRGRRITEDEAVDTAAFFVERWLASDHLYGVVASCDRPIAFGVGRLDVSEDSVRGFLRRYVRDRARQALFADGPEATTGEPNAIAGLRAVKANVAPRIEESSWALRQARMFEYAHLTRSALLELIPKPEPPPAMSFWQRLWQFLCRFICFWRVATVSRVDEVEIEAPAPTEPSRVHADRLERVDRLNFLIDWLDHDLGEAPTTDNSSPLKAAYDVSLGELPVAQRRIVERLAVDDAEIAYRVRSAISAEELLANRSAPHAIVAAIDQIGERLLKLSQRRRLIDPNDFRDVFAAMATTVAPLFCGSGGQPVRLAFVPPDWLDTFALADYQIQVGRDGEVTYFVLQPDAALSDILGD